MSPGLLFSTFFPIAFCRQLHLLSRHCVQAAGSLCNPWDVHPRFRMPTAAASSLLQHPPARPPPCTASTSQPLRERRAARQKLNGSPSKGQMKASLGAATTRRRTIGLIISRTERPDGDAAALGTVPVSREAGARHCASRPHAFVPVLFVAAEELVSPMGSHGFQKPKNAQPGSSHRSQRMMLNVARSHPEKQ